MSVLDSTEALLWGLDFLLWMSASIVAFSSCFLSTSLSWNGWCLYILFKTF